MYSYDIFLLHHLTDNESQSKKKSDNEPQNNFSAFVAGWLDKMEPCIEQLLLKL
jgi:hypothetical protein